MTGDPTREDISMTTTDGGSTLLVAETGGCVAGFGEYGDRGRGPELFRLYVDPASWRRGVGSRLLEELEARMRDEGVESCVLYVHRENDAGRAFWRDRGFRRHPRGDRGDSPCEVCMMKEV